MAHCCFIQSCEYEAQYICLCLCYETYSCEFHLGVHLSLQYRSHTFDSILEEPFEWTKVAILGFLEKEKKKKEKLKKIIKSSFSKYFYEETRLDSDVEQINSLIEKVSQVSEQNQLSNPLNFQHNSVEIMLQEDPELYNGVQLYCRLNQLRLKKYQILNRAKNDEETEQEFRQTCSFYQNYASDPLLNQALQDYINAYKRISSLYLLDKSNLFIYDTESESEEKKSLEFSKRRLRFATIAPLPNGELFYYVETYTETYSDTLNSCSSFIIDKDYKFRLLPFGIKSKYASAIYFNRSVYFFGGKDAQTISKVSCRFDLDENRWIQLAKIPRDDNITSSIISNNNILISGSKNIIYLYSFETDSFSEILYDDILCYRIKLLINSKERLYVIELRGHSSIFESDPGNVYAWKRIGKSTIFHECDQWHCSYNNGEFYIAILDDNFTFRQYFKFDLSRKTLDEMSCYILFMAIRRNQGKLEGINGYDKKFQLNFGDVSDLINKRYSLCYLVSCLLVIDKANRDIKLYPSPINSYESKASTLRSLDRNIEAIEIYDKIIELKPQDYIFYIQKGETFHDIGRNLEAIECYNQAKIIYSGCEWVDYNKGIALHDLNRYHEAIDCYNKAIQINYKNCDAYYLKGEALYALGKTAEALECYKLHRKTPESKYDDYKYKFQNCIAQGKALYDLNRKLEAIECYNELVNLNNMIFLHYCYRAIMLNDIGREEEALQDFNKAYDLISTHSSCINHGKNHPYNYNFIDETAFEYFIGLMKIICTLEEGAIKFKDEIGKLKDAKNVEILKEIEEKEILVKEMNSKILKKAVECLDSSRNVPIETIQQAQKEVAECHQETINVCAHLGSLLSAQQ